jgi:predicted dehydrogenase
MNSTPLAGCTRRTFLKHAAIAGAALGFPAVLSARNPNGRVQVAAVGVEKMGYNDVHNVARHEKARHVAFCDVDSTHFARADKLTPGVPHFKDFRVMLDNLGDQIDAVSVSTPDHMHARIAIEAMKRGKHVYCQKPLAHTVWEARQMQLWAAKTGVVTQMGNQIHSAIEYRLATRLIHDGVIGKVKEVRSWQASAGNSQSWLLEPPEPGPVPAELDWDLWLGGAPARPYAPEVYHPAAWRDWQDFGGGILGDFGCHILDPVFTSLGIEAPLSISATNSGINRHVWPTFQTVQYVFPGNERTVGDTLTVTWTDGGLQPERKLAQMPPELDLPKSGSLFIGEKGNLVLPHVGGPRLYPVETFAGFAYPKDLTGLNHWHRWVDAIVAGTKTSDGFDYAGPLTETVQLGNVATRMARSRGKRRTKEAGATAPGLLQWDAVKCRITNNPEANALLTKTYRRGWEVPPA